MYSLRQFGHMIADNARMRAYETALRRAITPGCVVVDIGAGPGILSLLACQMGASKVYAIEPNDAIHVARELALANGYDKRITTLQQTSFETKLLEPADVVVFDIRGSTPLYAQCIATIKDARQRLLRKGGILIPKRDVVWVAPLATDDIYEKSISIWTKGYAELKLNSSTQYLTNETLGMNDVQADQLLADAKVWAELDYATIENPDVANELTWIVNQDGLAHGLGMWFDAYLTDDIAYSSVSVGSCAEHATIYGSTLFPWPQPVQLTPGDLVTADIRAKLIGDTYLWSWRTKILGQGDPNHCIGNFQQNTFFADPGLTPATLSKFSDAHRPSLNRKGDALKFVLTCMDGTLPIQEIAQRLTTTFPDNYPHLDHALTFVRDISRKHG
jgi:type I protein arginine methyltransferase